MLNISYLKGDSKAARKTALGAIFLEKIRGTSFFIEKSIENQDVDCQKLEISEQIRLIFELDRDIDVKMLYKKFEGCEIIISGVIV